MATVRLENIKKRFGKTEVIHGISLDITDGEFIVLVGPSGCGKSTLLRMVAGLEGISEGELFINEQRANDKEPMDRDVAMVFQNYALYPHMTVAQNMAYSLKVAKVSQSEIDEKVLATATLLQLETLLDRKPKALSGGQRQRVAMGRAIVRQPALFLFDEPLSNLDAKLRVQMRLEIKDLQRQLGVTSLYVTHDQVEAMTMADRMIVLNAGIAEQIGTPLEVYERPASVFAAQFIGSPSMNIMDAIAKDNHLEFGDGVALPHRIATTGAIKLGVRPEHFRYDPKGATTVVVHMAELLGANTLLHGHLKSTREAVVVSLPGVYRDYGKDSEIRLSVDAEHLHCFDAETDQRIE